MPARHRAAARAEARASVRRPGQRLPGEQRRREIVAAVLALARDVGPDAITTHAIAARMGVTQGAVFRHFPDKASIWLAVFAFVRAGLQDVVTAALTRASTPLARLESTFLAHVDFVARNPGVARVLYHELQFPRDSPVRAEVRRMLGDYRTQLARLFRDACAAGELPDALDQALATVLFVGAVQGLVVDAALRNDESAMSGRARATFRMLVEGYAGGSRPTAGTARHAAARAARSAR